MVLRVWIFDGYWLLSDDLVGLFEPEVPDGGVNAEHTTIINHGGDRLPGGVHDMPPLFEALHSRVRSAATSNDFSPLRSIWKLSRDGGASSQWEQCEPL